MTQDPEVNIALMVSIPVRESASSRPLDCNCQRQGAKHVDDKGRRTGPVGARCRREAAEMQVLGQASAYLLSDLGKLFKLGVHLSEMEPHEHLFTRGTLCHLHDGAPAGIRLVFPRG